MMKELIEEAIYLLMKGQEQEYPEWKEGVGDCHKQGCEHCRIGKCISGLESIETLQSKGKTKEGVKTDMRYHAVQFANFILKHAETFTTKEGMFTWKRPNGKEQSSSELYLDWIEEYGEQPLLSEIVERTQQQQKEALKRRDNHGNYLDNLRPMDI